MNNKKEMEELQKENDELRNKVQELEERLKKYTNGENHKRYYEKNKDKIKEQGSNYLKKLKEENPEKLKEYRRNYYLKKKQLKEQDDNN
jgi:predicted MPP superfamily phosphohydrolase